MKTISLAVNVRTNGLAWERLGGAAKRRKCVTLMIDALENAGLLLPEVIHENHEVTVTSSNICEYILSSFKCWHEFALTLSCPGPCEKISQGKVFLWC